MAKDSKGSRRVARGPAPCALETVYLLERDHLLRWLRRKVGPDHAHDVAQEVFLRIAASGQLPLLQNPGGYVNRIARNVLIDGARRKRCRISPLPLAEAFDAPFAAEQEQALEVADLRAILEAALEVLPDKTRQVFVMHRFEDMAYREIHRELGISLATVEYHMMKALAHIRSALASVR